MVPKKKLVLVVIIAVSITLLLVALLLHPPLNNGSTNRKRPAEILPGPVENSIKIMTLNLAHGRKNHTLGLIKGKADAQSNLDSVADVLKRENPYLIGLQEADGPSAWSGGFNHIDYLAKAAGYSWHARGEHVNVMGLSYGTALVCQKVLSNVKSMTFESSLPAFPKGCLSATLTWPHNKERKVDVISLHLDFLSKTTRKKQITAFCEFCASNKRALILMGDFNCDWASEDSAVRLIAENLKLKAYKPLADGMETFPSTGKRLDWILISEDLEFIRHDLIQDCISDHLGVLAVIRFREE